MPRISTTKVCPQTFLTIDASTNSMAFALVQRGVVVEYGKIAYEGKNLDEKIKDIAEKTHAFFEVYKVDTVVIEDTVFINSRQTVTLLSKCHGALLAGAYIGGVQHTFRVSPIAWQSYIGTRLLTSAEKTALKRKYPGKTPAWYKAKEREIRKQNTIDTVNKKYGFSLTDDDIADACGLAMFCVDNWSKVIAYGRK